MTKFFTKKLLPTLFICCAAFFAKAQVGFNYSQYDIGVGFNTNQVFGDASTSPITVTPDFNFTYNYTPYTNFALDAQFGTLKGGALNTRSTRQFVNSFSAYSFRAQLQLGELIDYSRSPVANFMKNAYISAGVGYIINQITSIKRDNVYGKYSPGLNDSREPYVPLRLGYEFKVFNQYNEPSFKVDLGLQMNMMFNDNLDGYTAGSGNDVYTQLTVALKFAIGGAVTSYRKQIQY